MMRHVLFFFVVAALSVQQAVSLPFNKRGTDDTVILQFALTLEHLEAAFYTEALAQFDEQAFETAGFSPLVRKRYQEILQHEKTHVQIISDALGNDTVQACNYSFPITDVKSFTALSLILEGGGSSAYTGAIQSLTDPTNLLVGASILATEARQQSWISNAVEKVAPWGESFETPVSLNEAFTLASTFITSCPSNNPVLPFKTYPALTIGNAVPGQNTSVVSASGSPTFIVFLFALDAIFVPIIEGQVLVPTNVSGQGYAVSTASGTNASEIISGPVILLIEQDAAGNLIN